MFRKSINVLILIAFCCSLISVPKANAVETPFMASLTQPGTMVALSPAYEPALIKGMTVHKDNPFLFNFIVDTGDDVETHRNASLLKQEGDRLIKYFFASLTIPEKDLWVNLSPYEKDRMVPQALGQTAMGRDLLAQDYMLKQLTASLIYPEKELGKNFWDKVYAQAREQFGTTQIPVNTFNKVWIVAEKASVFEHNQTAFVVSGHLKVMLEEDYLATVKKQHQAINLTQNIVRQIILPAIENEINTGKNFATLRQIFYAQILATWFKKNLKQALLSQVYADKSTVKGVNLEDPSIKEKIYQRYLEAYKKGAFNLIKEETDKVTQKVLPRKYFSGGYSVSPTMLTTATREQAAVAAGNMRRSVDFAVVVNTDAVMNPPIGEFTDEEIDDLSERLETFQVTNQTTGDDLRRVLGKPDIVLINEIKNEDDLNQLLKEGKIVLAFHGSFRDEVKPKKRVPISSLRQPRNGRDYKDIIRYHLRSHNF